MSQCGFTDAGNILNQQVSPCEQARYAVADLRRFSDNDRVKLIQERLKFFFNVHVINLTAKVFRYERDWLFHSQRLLEA